MAKVPQIQPSEESGGLGAPANNILESIVLSDRDAKTGPAWAGGSGQSGGSGTYRHAAGWSALRFYRPNTQMGKPGEKMQNKTAQRNILPLWMCSLKAAFVPRNTFLKCHQMFQEHSEFVKLETLKKLKLSKSRNLSNCFLHPVISVFLGLHETMHYLAAFLELNESSSEQQRRFSTDEVWKADEWSCRFLGLFVEQMVHSQGQSPGSCPFLCPCVRQLSQALMYS